MATIVFGALGTLVGGPLGGAIGSLIGNKLDHAVVGGGSREGPRLQELKLATSTYGRPLPRLFGSVRTSGTVIWATDLQETSSTSGGKGQPKTTQYSYSVSIAVALSSRPIEGLGRIWADGNLLRGAAGDLKTGGTVRLHKGHADQEVDPLIVAALGARCPAYRGTAYVVFEDLALGEFGNRLPALSFEVFASGAGAGLAAALIEPLSEVATAAAFPVATPVQGFEHDGGTLADALSAVGRLVPMTVESGLQGSLVVRPTGRDLLPSSLPSPIAWGDGDFGVRTGSRRATQQSRPLRQLRYYDQARDYQPGLQRSTGRALSNGAEAVLEFPGVMSAEGAKALLEASTLRDIASRDTSRVRVSSLAAALDPGERITLTSGDCWDVTEWEWREGGVELTLVRAALSVASSKGSDSGEPWRPADRAAGTTILHAFSLPWDGMGDANADQTFVAVGATEGRWAGATLFAERAGVLVPLGHSSLRRSVIGMLVETLPPSPSVLFEPSAKIVVAFDDSEASLTTCSPEQLANGANRILVGDEVCQFMAAEPLGGGRWQLSGLLRGRGGTEADARRGHSQGARVVFLDGPLERFDGSAYDPANERLAALGTGDSEPVFATVASGSRGRRPLSPVHAVAALSSDGTIHLAWTRRARGAWTWRDEVATPLVEEVEAYEIGVGDAGDPERLWTSATPSLTLSASDREDLGQDPAFWVRQLGTFGRSPETNFAPA